MKLILTGGEINHAQAQYLINNHYQNFKDLIIAPLAYQMLETWANKRALLYGYQGNYLEASYEIELSAKDAIDFLQLKGDIFDSKQHYFKCLEPQADANVSARITSHRLNLV